MNDQNPHLPPEPPTPSPGTTAATPRRLPRRLLAAGAAAVLATAGVAAGWAAHGLRDGASPASTGWQSGPSRGSDPRSGLAPAPGRGLPGGGDGFSGPGTSGGSSSGSLGATRASADQVAGLVRIVAVSSYDGSAAAGTGMVLTSSGEVVTNNHVVEGSTRIRATVESTGRTYAARLVATDPRDDVAVLQLRGAAGLTAVTTDTNAVQRGDSVVAVGDAEGSPTLSAAPGTVTALRRAITTSDSGGASGERLRGLLQVDADVVSGDSGGAVLNADGQVVGMTTAASSGSANITGYAIPVAKVLRIVGVADSGVGTAAVHLGYGGFLGVELSPRSSSPTVAAVIDGTPAARSGVTPGSTVTSVDGHPVSTAAQLHRLVAAHRPGDVVRLGWRDGSGSHAASVQLARGPAA